MSLEAVLDLDAHDLHELALIEDAAWKRWGVNRFAVSFKKGARLIREPFLRGPMQKQLGGPDLPANVAVRELKKQDQSLYWPLFRDDPFVTTICDRCNFEVRVGADGFCPHCTQDFDI